MAISDDIAALGVRATQLDTDRAATTAQIKIALFTRLRPIAQLTFLSDDELTICCNAFALDAVRVRIPPRAVTAPPPV